MTYNYNYGDPAIAKMLTDDHWPVEPHLATPGEQVTCRKCAEPWPCAVITELRQHWGESVK